MNDALPRTSAILNEGIIQGLHLGAQVFASMRQNTVADFALGESRPGVLMTPETITLWLSASKPITAIAIAQQWEWGRLELDDPVARHIPEFATKGKEPVTIRQVLTHTAGFRWVDTGWPAAPWDEIIRRICDAPQERGWIAGRKAGYSPYVSWFLLGEIVRRLDGRDFAQYVREEILVPLRMNDSWLALRAGAHRAYGDRIGILYRTDKGAPVDAGLDTEQATGAARPSGGGRGPARELGRFYEMLLAGGTLEGARIVSPQTVEALVARHRVGMHDATFNHVMDWGLGFLINQSDASAAPMPYGYGPYALPRTYGHGGSQSSTAFADPERGLAVAIVCNGMPGELAHQQRMRAVVTALYEDLSLD